MKRAAVLPLHPGTFAPHALHRGERDWPEANCYVDLWIDALHALGFEPTAALAFTLAVDFEGDQWTFFKPPLADLYRLYGIVVEELNVWWSLPEHLYQQVARGRLAIVEADSFYLPDTAGTAYHSEHTKTGIAVQEIDLEGQRLGYFHNTGYHALEGEDFRGLFGLELAPEARPLPPYVELAKLGVRPPVPEAELTREATRLLGAHLQRRPRRNPIAAYHARFADDAEWLRQGGVSAFHRYAFATLRQLGAATELGALFLDWLSGRGEPGLEPAVGELRAISAAAKALQFKLARAVHGRRPIEVTATMQEMELAWERSSALLSARYPGAGEEVA